MLVFKLYTVLSNCMIRGSKLYLHPLCAAGKTLKLCLLQCKCCYKGRSLHKISPAHLTTCCRMAPAPVDEHCNKGRIYPGPHSGKNSLHNIPNDDAKMLRKQLFVYFIQYVLFKRLIDFREGHQTQSVMFVW